MPHPSALKKGKIMIEGKANVIIDGQWGSTGKGKLAGYLALNHDIALATCDFMSNAGHTFVYDDGVKFVTCQLPTAVVNPYCIMAINAGASITVDRLLQEVEEHSCHDRLLIHPHACIITEEDRKHEGEVLKRISSTLKGCGGSISRKVMRVAKLAKDEPKLARWISDTTEVTRMELEAGKTVLVEGAQGFDLSLNHGYRYPYVTSRDVTTMSILNNAGISIPNLGDVYGTLRTYPIRVGDMYENGKKIGTSGGFYSDQREVGWEDVKQYSGANKDLVETTTVTGKVRRVFTFSYGQYFRFVDVCAPTKLFINFINHINSADEGVRTFDELSEMSKAWLNTLQHQSDKKYDNLRSISPPKITHIGTGAKNSDMIKI